MLWRGSAASAVDLNPTNIIGYDHSIAFGLSDTQQVGHAGGSATRGFNHAMLWNGTANSAVDLNPTNLGSVSKSEAYGTDGTHQVGEALIAGSRHAMLWTGAANSAVDLNPTNLTNSFTLACAVFGAQQVGYGWIASSTHALLWFGTANSLVDLNPTNLPLIDTSYAVGTNGVHQVGFGSGAGTGGKDHAFLWTGSANSAVDLHALLESTFVSSHATSIDDQGNIFGFAQDSTGAYHAVEWSLSVPLPSVAGAGLLTLAITLLHARLPRRHRAH